MRNELAQWTSTGSPLYLRVDRNTALTPVLRYVDDGHVITVVGLMQVAYPRYYRDVRDYVEGLRSYGAAVHCEGMNRVAQAEDWRAAGPLTREVLTEWDRGIALQAAMAAHLGWATQDSLNLEGWEVRDISVTAATAMVGVARMLADTRGGNERMAWPDVTAQGVNDFRTATAIGLRLMAHEARTGRSKDLSTGSLKVKAIRSELALAGALAAVSDVVLVWGTRHLPELHEGLTKAGYAGVYERWLTVAELPPLNDVGLRVADV